MQELCLCVCVQFLYSMLLLSYYMIFLKNSFTCLQSGDSYSIDYLCQKYKTTRHCFLLPATQKSKRIYCSIVLYCLSLTLTNSVQAHRLPKLLLVHFQTPSTKKKNKQIMHNSSPLVFTWEVLQLLQAGTLLWPQKSMLLFFYHDHCFTNAIFYYVRAQLFCLKFTQFLPIQPEVKEGLTFTHSFVTPCVLHTEKFVSFH